jgi:hypothetical protein
MEMFRRYHFTARSALTCKTVTTLSTLGRNDPAGNVYVSSVSSMAFRLLVELSNDQMVRRWEFKSDMLTCHRLS